MWINNGSGVASTVRDRVIAHEMNVGPVYAEVRQAQAALKQAVPSIRTATPVLTARASVRGAGP